MPDAIDPSSVDGQLFTAARNGDATTLATLLDRHPDKLHVRLPPYGMSLLHIASQGSQGAQGARGSQVENLENPENPENPENHLAVLDLLLRRGLDPNTRENGDNTTAMHWAAAAGSLDLVRRLSDSGGDVIGDGDDHQLAVIGWATCWDEGNPDTQRAVAEFLISRGARHHIFSAIALNLADEVRRIVAADPSALNHRQSRNENHRTPLHFAVNKQRPEMVALLLELGADPLAVDGSGQPIAIYASTPDIDRPVMERIRAMTAAELDSAVRGHRPANVNAMDLVALLALREWETAATLLREHPRLVEPAGGVLHLMVKRNDIAAVTWLLEHGADPSSRWAHWDADVTPLHLAALQGHIEMARVLLAGGADSAIRDSRHDADAIGWAEFFQRADIVQLLKSSQRRG
jgi:ankyrin repeat protein